LRIKAGAPEELAVPAPLGRNFSVMLKIKLKYEI
jgi:hypothetical protein